MAGVLLCNAGMGELFGHDPISIVVQEVYLVYINHTSVYLLWQSTKLQKSFRYASTPHMAPSSNNPRGGKINLYSRWVFVPACPPRGGGVIVGHPWG